MIFAFIKPDRHPCPNCGKSMECSEAQADTAGTELKQQSAWQCPACGCKVYDFGDVRHVVGGDDPRRARPL